MVNRYSPSSHYFRAVHGIDIGTHTTAVTSAGVDLAGVDGALWLVSLLAGTADYLNLYVQDSADNVSFSTHADGSSDDIDVDTNAALPDSFLVSVEARKVQRYNRFRMQRSGGGNFTACASCIIHGSQAGLPASLGSAPWLAV